MKLESRNAVTFCQGEFCSFRVPRDPCPALYIPVFPVCSEPRFILTRAGSKAVVFLVIRSDCQSFLHLQVMMCINHVLCNYTAVFPHTVALILPVPGGSERRAPHNSFGWLNSEKSPHTPQIAHKQKGQDKTQASGLLPESSFPAPSTLRGPCAI